MFDWPWVVWFCSLFHVKKYEIVEDPDELGYWLVEIEDED